MRRTVLDESAEVEDAAQSVHTMREMRVPMRADARQRRLVGATLISALVAAMTVLATKAPSSLPIPPCPFRLATGLLCPFCGSTRAVHELLQGNVHEAVSLSPLGVASVPLAIGLVVWALAIPLLRGDPVRSFRLRRSVAWGSAFVVAGVWVLRNVPSLWPLPVTA